VFYCDAIYEIAVNGSIQPPLSLGQPGYGFSWNRCNERGIRGLRLMGTI